MKKILTLSILAGVTLSVTSAFAFMPKQIASYFNGPTVSSITANTATVSLSESVLADITAEEKAGLYFEYGETKQVCIMIFPTPTECLPKKTEVGKTTVDITGLKPNTSYTILYKRDNTIRCVTTPCPTNDFESLSVTFTTKADGTDGTPETGGNSPSGINRNLGYGARGADVLALQNILISQGYLTSAPTGYFGGATLRAVKNFQRANNIVPSGYVGLLTRKALANITTHGSPSSLLVPVGAEETFEGTITAFSTACFADGECSVTVDGKKVVTTIGWSQAIVGQVLGVPDFGSIESKIGSRAKVYAKKTTDGYTLYGSAAYYVQVLAVPTSTVPVPIVATTTVPTPPVSTTTPSVPPASTTTVPVPVVSTTTPPVSTTTVPTPPVSTTTPPVSVVATTTIPSIPRGPVSNGFSRAEIVRKRKGLPPLVTPTVVPVVTATSTQ